MRVIKKPKLLFIYKNKAIYIFFIFFLIDISSTFALLKSVSKAITESAAAELAVYLIHKSQKLIEFVEHQDYLKPQLYTTFISFQRSISWPFADI